MSNSAPQDSSLPAADTDRIQVAQLLTDSAAQGRLTLTDYEDRLTRAYAATTFDELDALSADLPDIANTRRGACKPAPSTMLLAIMSGFERRGRWNVPPKLTTFTLFGGGVVDLRYADFTSSRGRDPCLLHHGWADDPAAARGQREDRRPGRDGRLRPQRRRCRCRGRPEHHHQGFRAVGQGRNQTQEAQAADRSRKRLNENRADSFESARFWSVR